MATIERADEVVQTALQSLGVQHCHPDDELDLHLGLSMGGVRSAVARQGVIISLEALCRRDKLTVGHLTTFIRRKMLDGSDGRSELSAAQSQLIDQQITDILVESLNIHSKSVKPTAALQEDLGAESIDFLDITFRLERAFGIRINRGEMISAMEQIAMGDGAVASTRASTVGRLRSLVLQKLNELEEGKGASLA